MRIANLWQALKAFNLFRLLENEIVEMFSMGRRKQKQTQIRWNKTLRSWRGTTIFYKSWSWKWISRLLYKFSSHFRKISCFISKNILSKVVLKYQVSMLTCPSLHPAYSKILFRIMRTVNPLSQPYIIRKFQNIYPLVFVIVTKRLLWDLSLLHLKTMSFRGTYWLSDWKY